MHIAIPPLPHTSSWCGGSLHEIRNNCNFYLFLYADAHGHVRSKLKLPVVARPLLTFVSNRDRPFKVKQLSLTPVIEN
jgi:hypothetical protein